MSPFGFESGCAAFTFQNPPPLVPSILMASWLAAGPPGITWEPSFEGLDHLEAVEVLDHALAQVDEGDDERDGQEHAGDAAGDVDPEVAERVGRRRAMPRMSATATAMPAAAEAKFWTASPAIWVRWLTVDSG